MRTNLYRSILGIKIRDKYTCEAMCPYLLITLTSISSHVHINKAHSFLPISSGGGGGGRGMINTKFTCILYKVEINEVTDNRVGLIIKERCDRCRKDISS